MHHFQEPARPLTTATAALFIAGSIASVAHAQDMQPTALPIAGHAAPHGYVYINQGTGERVVSHEATETTALRGSAWTWDNSVIDPCAPSQDEPLVAAIFTGILDDESGDRGTADAVNYWSDWFEAPADTIISGFTFGYFSQMVDPGEDGVDGQEYFLVFTENDRAGCTTTAIAHSPILIGDLMGAEDDGANGAAVAGDGVIDFAEGNYWVYFVDFASLDTPTDIEVADSNGVSDGAFGPDSTFSGIPGVDNTPPGSGHPVLEGLFNCGFYIGMRQPGVAEGDGIIDRFPELAGSGIENPDGLDIPSLANIVPMGFPLAFPSADLSSYDPEAGSFYWPQAADYVPQAGEAIGSYDWFGFYNAIGMYTGTFRFRPDFECDPAATAPPYYNIPWASPDIRFNVDGGPKPECCFSDIDCNGIFDLADIYAFIAGFLAGDPIADGNDDGLLDLADIVLFVAYYQDQSICY